jgi:ribosome-binding factor A
MASYRKERVRELLRRAIGEAIRREIPVGSAGLVSVNDVDLSGDLRSAKVYISVLGTADQQKTALAVLQQLRVRIQDLVAKSVVLKYMPQLRFLVDESVVRGNRVLKIIEEIEGSSAPSEA